MKTKKLLSLALALVMLLGCMTVTAFAGGGGVSAILGETYTATIHGTLSEDEQDGNVKDIVSSNPDCIKIISITAGKDAEQNDIVTVVHKAIKITDEQITIDYKKFNQESGDWGTFSNETYDGVIAPSDYLDLESSATYSDKKDIDQNYTFTQASEEYTDVTKVKLEWTITDIAATYTSNKTWDPDTLTWKETKTVGELANKTAEFTLTNYSSKKVVGTVSFKAEDALSATLASAAFDANNGATIDTVVNDDYSVDETKKTNVPSNKITATLTFNKDKFADLTATTSATKYGTYTVTISKYVPQKLNLSEVVYSGRSEYEVNSTLVYEGSTWQAIVANNTNNTVTLSLYEVADIVCTMKISGTKVILEGSDGINNYTFNLMTESSEMEVEKGTCIQATDAVTDTVYLYKVSN